VQGAKRRGATVFMSSHVMSEVQQTAERVGIIRDGRLLAVESVQSLREHALRSVTLTFGGPFDADDFRRLPGFADVTVTGRTLRGRLAGHTDELVKAASRYDVADLRCEEPDLEEIFFHYYERPEADRVAA
jgi:ABC-2 type transport system ATP-binding protein